MKTGDRASGKNLDARKTNKAGHPQPMQGIRDPAALEKMPESERRACEKLWAAVGELLTKVKEK
jgi:hypothetical protein